MSRQQITQIAGLAGLCFLILGSYAMARPATESLFLEFYSYQDLPKVWLAVACGSVLVVVIYNRFSARANLVRLFGAVAAISGGVLGGLLMAGRAEVPGVAFALYVWKDLYIVVLVEIFWSFANVVIPLRHARRFYGLFCVLGSLGGLTGNLLGGAIALRYGSTTSLQLILPILALAWAACLWLSRLHPVAVVSTGGVRAEGGLRILFQSRYLGLLLALIAVVQVVITLIDYQYNHVLQLAYPDTDERTAVTGRVYATIDFGSLWLQLATARILHRLGVGRTLLLIPLSLACAVGGTLALPRFGAIAVAKVLGKCLDYSLFRAAKELLYIPLTHEEKTQGKAVVDMMTYRVAKGGTSLLLLALGSIGLQGLSVVALVGLGVWIKLTTSITRRYQEAQEGT